MTWSQLGYTNDVIGSGFKATVRDLYAGRDLGVFEDGFEAQVSSYDVMAIRITPTGQVETHSEGQVLSSEWRPWSDESAAALQARMREASQRARKRAAIISKIVAFILAHKYSLAFAVAAFLGAIIVAVVRCVLSRSRRERVRYEACAQSEMSFKFGKGGSVSSSPIMWEALPPLPISRSASASSDDSSLEESV